MRFPTDNDPEEMQWLENLSNLGTQMWKILYLLLYIDMLTAKEPWKKVDELPNNNPEELQWLGNLSILQWLPFENGQSPFYVVNEVTLTGQKNNP